MEKFLYGVLRKEIVINHNTIYFNGMHYDQIHYINKYIITSKIEYLKQLLINSYNVEKIEEIF